MTEANGQRMVLAARLSRKKTGTERVEGVSIEVQDGTARSWAEREGHAVIGMAADIKSGTTAPWKRKNLRPWMEDPSMLAMYDAVLFYHVDRLSRGTDEDWHYIEDWAYRTGKRLIMANGPQFPPRNEADKYQWIAMKDASRREWERIRDRQIGTQANLKANGHAVGRYPFGYTITGDTYSKQVVIDPVNGPLAKEAFKRVAEGKTASSVALWLTEQTGELWRVKRVTDMIKRRTYLGERDGHTFEAIVTEDEWNAANNGLAGRSFTHGDQGGGRIVHGYSGVIYCECGRVLYRHKSERGREKYLCSKGRSGDLTEARCSRSAPSFAPVNAAVEALMSRVLAPERVMIATGGDHGRRMELQRLQDEMKDAMARMDMEEVTRLAASVSELQKATPEPIQVIKRETGRSYADVWASGSIDDRRALLKRDEYRLVVRQTDYDKSGWRVFLEPSKGRESVRMFQTRDWRLSMSEEVAA